MPTHHLVSEDGSVILPGRMLHAVQGPHAGTHWKLRRILHRGGTHLLECHRLVHGIRTRMEFLPSVFGLAVIAVSTLVGEVSLQPLHWLAQQSLMALFAGLLALIPLGFFEALNGGEHTRRLLEMIFGD